MLTLVSVREIYLGLEISRIPKPIKDGSRKIKNPVVLKTSQGFELLFGRRALQAHNGTMIKCDVLDSVTKERRRELILGERYDSGGIPRIQMGKDFLEILNDFPKMTRRGLAYRIMTAEITIYHHIALAQNLTEDLQDMVTEGKLASGVAYAITALDDERQREVAQPFIEGKLNGIDAVPLVHLAKEIPEAPLQTLIKVLHGNQDTLKQDSSDENEWQPPIPQPSSDLDVDAMVKRVLEMAGQLDELVQNLHKVSNVSRLTLKTHLRVLQSRMDVLRSTLESVLKAAGSH